MVDIFTLLLAILSICALAGVATKIMLTPPKVWDEEWIPMEIEERTRIRRLWEINRTFGWINSSLIEKTLANQRLY